MTAKFGHPILLPRFWAKVRIDEATGCWVWTAHRTSDGYGRYRIGDTMVAAHRVAYEAFNTWIPEGFEIDHVVCRNPPCVNPDHLEAVSREEHLRRWHHNRIKTHCPQGHPYDDDNTYIAPNGERRCRECNRQLQHRRSHPT